jgi:hypothetical protein
MYRHPTLASSLQLPTPRLVGRRDFTAWTLGAATAIPLLSQPLFACTALAADRTPLGSVEKMQKIAGATNGADSRSLTIGDKVFRDDLLWTRSHGQLRINLLDGGNLSLGENAEVALDESMLGGGGSAFMRVLSGAFRFSSGGGEKAATPPKIETPFAVLSLRGTEVYGARFGRSLGFLVTSGQVEVSNDTGSVVLNEGEGTEVSSRKGELEAPKKWGAAKVAHLKALLRY